MEVFGSNDNNGIDCANVIRLFIIRSPLPHRHGPTGAGIIDAPAQFNDRCSADQVSMYFDLERETSILTELNIPS